MPWSPTPRATAREAPVDSPGSPRVILVEPRGGANVGAICRAIKNMGGGGLITVRGGYDHEQARRMAVHAADVLAGCQRVETLQQALRGCGQIIGTTAHDGPYRRRAAHIHDLARALVERRSHEDPPIALVFGPEDRGLSNREVALCHRLATIPSSGLYASLNLAQAVMICLYEVRLAGLEGGGVDGAGRPMRVAADAAELEAAYSSLQEALLAIGFLAEENPGHIMATIRALLGRAAPDQREVSVLRGLARQILWFAGRGREVAEAKRKRGEKLR